MLGDKIKKLRKQKGLTQQELSEIIGISRSTIGMVEKNLQGTGNETLKKLADFFDVTIDYLLSENENNDSIKLEADEAHHSNINGIKLNKKDMRDIEKTVEATISELEKQDSLMLSGNPVDDADWELIKSAIRNGIEYAKRINKDKYASIKHKK
ncbi:transcriptional regulator with XRE-family HTH domain [Clostridium saccharoperbutylacetonicum]|uniref:Putative transcriptional regulator n=1 Tax=Clostridium saccharoperbutylacetonicum N1-4(HMT) TaxID=931276 RepID=M1MYC8_9CLOT|nr:helix-turn-helix transcriptional regulator [Clostridium saccharoperbutylacetonicum]AGF56417.1 putative transcriptional regulator [Clostridium saccharoperbutylacetonicum N1-4(HMT)]NRT62839.1 transcriptional regulator with XRE-family HTH domain [Clostridium saccharoperbutylacetonicum]NSB26194.1 transcriptional regulator with XRE-family HTH domain [Clostridium saccharoperbutylacetonicum]NSB45547.1 transcriptional regulator with XRE-family HTH domain [Clostridium saccharoperbutylacetonicum]